MYFYAPLISRSVLPRFIDATVLFVWKQLELFKLIEVTVFFVAIAGDYPAAISLYQR